MKEKLKNKSGITLIALVVTIIVLLILAGVSLKLIRENGGIIGKGEVAVNETEKKVATEKMDFIINSAMIECYEKNRRKPTLQELADELCKNEDGAIEYLYVKYADQAALDKVVIKSAEDLLVTKLEDYAYEFEIDNKLTIVNVRSINAKVDEDDGDDEEVEVGDENIEIVDVKARGFTIRVIPEDESKIAMYQYYIDGELIYQGIEKEYTVRGLNTDTNYKVSVKAVSKKFIDIGNFEQKTAQAPVVEMSNKFDKYIYIDSVNGNDTTGDGTKESPYATLDKIADSGIIETGYSYGIILRDGEYTLTEKIFELNSNDEINIIGNRQNTILNVQKIYGISDAGGNKNYKLNFYRLIWRNISTNNTNVIHVDNPMNFENICFDMSLSSSFTHGYFLSKGEKNFNNCTLMNETREFLRANNCVMKVTNSYGGFSSGYSTTDSDWNYATNYITSTPQVDSTTYRITEDENAWKNVGTGNDLDGTQADLGIYGGEYSWEYETDIDNKVSTGNTEVTEVEYEYKDSEIGNVKIQTLNTKFNEFTIKVTPEDESKIAMYQYYIDGELRYQGIEKEYKAKGLKSDTNYRISVKVVPKNLIDIGTVEQRTTQVPIIEMSNKFDKYIYIDSVNGNDTTGDGTKEKPYATLAKIAGSGIIETGYSYGIILKDGEYTLTEKIFELKSNDEINIIGNRQNTILNVGKIYGESYAEGSQNYKLNFYRLIWKNISTNNTNVIHVDNPMNFENICFDMSLSSSFTHGYFLSKGEKNFNNCTLMNKTTAFLRANNCVMKVTNSYGGFSSGYSTTDSDWNYATNYITSTPQVDSTTYIITDDENVWKDVGTGEDLDGTQADLGIYGGEFSWEYETDI